MLLHLPVTLSSPEGGIVRGKRRGKEGKDPTYTVPVFTILEFTSLFIPLLPVQKEDNKVDEVKVCERGVEAGWETPS